MGQKHVHHTVLIGTWNSRLKGMSYVDIANMNGWSRPSQARSIVERLKRALAGDKTIRGKQYKIAAKLIKKQANQEAVKEEVVKTVREQVPQNRFDKLLDSWDNFQNALVEFVGAEVEARNQELLAENAKLKELLEDAKTNNWIGTLKKKWEVE